jgi:hypothetical protein
MGKRMSDNHFFIEDFSTPTGTMLLLTDAEEHARALDWEDHAARVHQLLRLQYGTVRLEAKAGVSRIRRAIEAYFAGVLAAIADLPAVTAGTAFQREGTVPRAGGKHRAAHSLTPPAATKPGPTHRSASARCAG